MAKKVYKTKPRKGSGWELTDPVRSLTQGMDFVKGGYIGMDAILVETPEYPIFPYHTYTRRKR